MRGVFLLLCLLAFHVAAMPLSKDTPYLNLQGQLHHFSDASGQRSFTEVSQPDFVEQHFTRLTRNNSLGYNIHAHWFQASLEVAADAPSRWVLAVGSPELEEVGLYLQQTDGSFRHYSLGYHHPYDDRPVRTRQFDVPLDVFPGMQIFIHIQSTNALKVSAELWQVNAFTAQETQVNFYYGLYFGILLIAVVLYAILGAGLRDLTMAAYAGYVTSQLLFHLGATGYLVVLLNGFHSAYLSDALPRIGWLGGAIAIVLMWDSLLKLKQYYLAIHRVFLFTIALNLLLLPFALMPFLVGEWLLWVVKLANILNVLNFFIGLWLLFRTWQQSQQMQWMIYLAAFILPALGTMVNTATNQGLLPQSLFTNQFYLISVLVHVLVMSYGLALRLRQLQQDKTRAEQAAARAKQRATEQQRFFAMISHEFGNPLAAIDRAAQMIEITSPELAQSAAPRLNNIRNNATTLSNLIEQFLNSEALANGSLRVEKEPCALDDLLAAALTTQDNEQARIKLFPYPKGLVIHADATLLKIALGNLLSNALRYSPPHSIVELRVSQEAGKLRLSVLDSGPGLSTQELADIGQPWFRTSSSQGKKGTGLGYYFAQQIITAHQGHLSAQVRSEGGLQVSICLSEK